MIILWQNILKQHYVAQNSLLTTLPNSNFYHEHCDSLILYWSRIRKNVTNTQRNRERNPQRIQLQRPLYPRILQYSLKGTEKETHREFNYWGHYNPDGSPGWVGQYSTLWQERIHSERLVHFYDSILMSWIKILCQINLGNIRLTETLQYFISILIHIWVPLIFTECVTRDPLPSLLS